jgi:hypothetical protein
MSSTYLYSDNATIYDMSVSSTGDILSYTDITTQLPLPSTEANANKYLKVRNDGQNLEWAEMELAGGLELILDERTASNPPSICFEDTAGTQYNTGINMYKDTSNANEETISFYSDNSLKMSIAETSVAINSDVNITGDMTVSGSINISSVGNIKFDGLTEYNEQILFGTNNIVTVAGFGKSVLTCRTGNGNLSIQLLGASYANKTVTKFRVFKSNTSANSIRIVGSSEPVIFRTPFVSVSNFTSASSPNFYDIIPAGYYGSFDLVRVLDEGGTPPNTAHEWRVENIEIYTEAGTERKLGDFSIAKSLTVDGQLLLTPITITGPKTGVNSVKWNDLTASAYVLDTSTGDINIELSNLQSANIGRNISFFKFSPNNNITFSAVGINRLSGQWGTTTANNDTFANVPTGLNNYWLFDMTRDILANYSIHTKYLYSASGARNIFDIIDAKSVLNSFGTKQNPAYSFSSDTDTGIYRTGTNSLGVSCGNKDVADFKNDEVEIGKTGVGNAVNMKVWGDLEVTGNITGGVPAPSYNNLTLTGTTTIDGPMNVTGGNLTVGTFATNQNLTVNGNVTMTGNSSSIGNPGTKTAVMGIGTGVYDADINVPKYIAVYCNKSVPQIPIINIVYLKDLSGYGAAGEGKSFYWFRQTGDVSDAMQIYNDSGTAAYVSYWDRVNKKEVWTQLQNGYSIQTHEAYLNNSFSWWKCVYIQGNWYIKQLGSGWN